MRRGARGSFVFVVLVAACALIGAAPASASHYDRLLAPASACGGQTATTAKPAKLVRAAVCLHNHARQRFRVRKARSSGKPKPVRGLSGSAALRRSARAKAVDIFDCGQFSHGACGRDHFHWHRQVGYAKGCYGVAENLFYASRAVASPRAAMSAWLHSDAHREILLDPRYTDVGISARPGRFGGGPARLWVAHFGYRC